MPNLPRPTEGITMSTLALEHTSSIVTAKDGTQLYYKDWGKGPVVTFSHGWPLNSDMWDGQMLFLAQQGFRVVAHDRRGHGRSGQASSGNDMDGYADDLADVIETLDLRNVTLVGHSTGGGEVARYRAARPEACRKGGPHRRRTTDHAEVREQPGGLADRSLRQPAERPRQRPRVGLQGRGRDVLW